MKLENLNCAYVTNNDRPICDPYILTGSNIGPLNINEEISPKGTLIDLNGLWELFLSNKSLKTKLSFQKTVHDKDEIIDGIQYKKGDITYTLLDQNGDSTNAKFTISNQIVKFIEFENSHFIIYYSSTHKVTQEEIDSWIPMHYASEGIVYDYVLIPISEIFDISELKELFPWEQKDNKLYTKDLSKNVQIGTDNQLYIKSQNTTDIGNQGLISINQWLDEIYNIVGIIPIIRTNPQDILKERTAYALPHIDLTRDLGYSNIFEYLTKGIGNLAGRTTTLNDDINSKLSSFTIDGIIINNQNNSINLDNLNVEKTINKGQKNGYAPLNSSGLIDQQYLPSYVDDVIEMIVLVMEGDKAITIIDPVTRESIQGESGKIYIDINTNKQYRYVGSYFALISANLALGETSGTAYEGNKGKATTDTVNSHIQNTNNPHNVIASQVNGTFLDPATSTDVTVDIETIIQYTYDLVHALQAQTQYIGTISELEQLSKPTLAGSILDITPIDDTTITNLIQNTNFE